MRLPKRIRKSTTLQTLFSPDAQADEWMAAARAPKTGVGIWFSIAVGIAGLGALAWLVGSSKRQTACFADGHEGVGTVDRAIRHPGGGDDHSWLDLRISAVLPDGATLRRRLHLEGDHHDRRIGGAVRFRHNTLDPEALDDIARRRLAVESSRRRS